VSDEVGTVPVKGRAWSGLFQMCNDTGVGVCLTWARESLSPCRG
jgi:hypothetical protein